MWISLFCQQKCCVQMPVIKLCCVELLFVFRHGKCSISICHTISSFTICEGIICNLNKIQNLNQNYLVDSDHKESQTWPWQSQRSDFGNWHSWALGGPDHVNSGAGSVLPLLGGPLATFSPFASCCALDTAGYLETTFHNFKEDVESFRARSRRANLSNLAIRV